MPSLPNLDLHKSGDGVSVNRPDPRNKGAFPLISYLSNEELSDLWKNWGKLFLYNDTQRTQMYRVILDANYYLIRLIIYCTTLFKHTALVIVLYSSL